MVKLWSYRITRIAALGASVAALAVMVGMAAPGGAKRPVPFKEAKLNIEHNATDHDTGFQGQVDSEGWQTLDLVGPKGPQLHFEARGALGALGLTELFFESVEPKNAEVPLANLLADMPSGQYVFKGRGMIAGKSTGETAGTAWLTHDIPAGPELLSPAEGATVSITDLVVRWGAVTKTIRGGPVKIIGYQLILEKDVKVHPHMIGKWGLSMYLPPSVFSMAIPSSFLEARTAYKWEVLAIEESGNQTLSSGEFKTQ